VLSTIFFISFVAQLMGYVQADFLYSTTMSSEQIPAVSETLDSVTSADGGGEHIFRHQIQREVGIEHSLKYSY